MRTSQYSHTNHMGDYLRRLQGQEPHRVPAEVFDSVRHALVGEPCLESVERTLKRLNLRQYCDHAVQIYCRIAELEPLTLDSDQLRTFWSHFERVERAWPVSKSFLPYHYVAEQLLRAQNIDARLFIGSPDKLRRQEEIWQNVCAQSKL